LVDTLNGNEQVLVQKINWLIQRQNVIVALLVTSIIGSVTILKLSISMILFPAFVVVIMIEIWAIINYEQAIVRYQLQLEKIRPFWVIPRTTMVWAFLNKKDGSINWINLVFFEIIILIVAGVVYWVSS